MAQKTVITADTADAEAAIRQLGQQIMWAMPGAVNNSLRKIQDDIYTDYRRSGNSSPSSQNPSKSGLGFTDRTGRLRSSINYKTRSSSSKVVGTLQADTEYAVFVEQLWGGQYAYLLPALTQNEDYIIGQVSDAVIRAVNRMAK